MPLYRTFVILSQDQDSITSNEGKYVDLIDEMKKNSSSCKDLRIKLVQIDPPNDKSNNIHKNFNDSIDKLINRGNAMTSTLQADLRYKVSDNTFDRLYEIGASASTLNKELKEGDKAREQAEKAYNNLSITSDDFKNSKEQLDKSLKLK